MLDPLRGPFLFDASAQSWIARSGHSAISDWIQSYLSLYPFHVSAITVLERTRGYRLLWHRAQEKKRKNIESMFNDYLSTLGKVWPVDSAVAMVAGEIMALLPAAPTPPRRSHKFVESRQERVARWRFDVLIAATALVVNLPLIHNNAGDFEVVRSAIEQAPERFPGLGPLELTRCSSLI
jgi:predicted nucleic acid-binding protein